MFDTRALIMLTLSPLAVGCMRTPIDGQLQSNTADPITFEAVVPAGIQTAKVNFFVEYVAAKNTYVRPSCTPTNYLGTDSSNTGWYYCTVTASIPSDQWAPIDLLDTASNPAYANLKVPAGAKYWTLVSALVTDTTGHGTDLATFNSDGIQCATSDYAAGKSGYEIMNHCAMNPPRDVVIFALDTVGTPK